MGSTSAGHTFRQAAVQAVLLGFRVYTVLPLTRIVPNFGFLAVETTTVLAALVGAPAESTPTSAAESPPTAKAARVRRPTGPPRIVIWCRVVWCISLVSSRS